MWLPRYLAPTYQSLDSYGTVCSQDKPGLSKLGVGVDGREGFLAGINRLPTLLDVYLIGEVLYLYTCTFTYPIDL